MCARRRNVRKEGKIHTKSINFDIDIMEHSTGVNQYLSQQTNRSCVPSSFFFLFLCRFLLYCT